MERAVDRAGSRGPLLSSTPATTTPWLASRLLHRQVVNAVSLDPLGHVTDVVFDSERCRLVALDVRTQPTDSGVAPAFLRALGQGRGIISVGLDHIVALSGDVVIVNIEPADATPPAPAKRVVTRRLEAKHLHRLGEVRDLSILTLHGMRLGSLADVLLSHRGSVVLGYVVRPTKVAEQILLPFEGGESPAPQPPESAETDEPQPPSDQQAAPLPTGLRLIPASPRVRVGESLILVVEDVEPLDVEPVIVAPEIAPESDALAGDPTRADS